MTSISNPPNVAEVHPRPVVARLPKYVAGKPPATVEGLQSYKLSSNENPLSPLPAVLEAVASVTDLNRYPDPTASALRDELAGHLSVPADDIVTGTGSLGALNQILATFAGQNDHAAPDEVIYPWRSFEAYPISVGTSGATGVPVPVLSDGRHDLQAMIDAVTDNTKIILLCTPNNPTGPVLTTAETEWFIDQVRSDVVIVVDEAYVSFVRDADAVDGIDMYRKYPNVIALRSFSKDHGLAGLRVGYSVSNRQLTQHLRVTASPFTVSSVAQLAAITSLRHIDDVVARVQGLVDERDRVTAGLKDLGWPIPSAQGNFVWLALGANTPEFTARAEQQALSVRAFGAEGVRVSIGEVEANTRFLRLCADYTNCPVVS